MNRELSLSILLICLTSQTLLAQVEKRIRRDDLTVRVYCAVEKVSDDYLRYKYVFENSSLSNQSMHRAIVELNNDWLENGGSIRNVVPPSEQDWGYFPSVGEKMWWIAEYDTTGLDILERSPISSVRPGETLRFTFEARGLPGVGQFWAAGWAPWFFSQEVRDSLLQEGYPESELHATDDKFLKGYTVVRRSPVVPFSSAPFVDTLISYTMQSRSLGWITSQATANKYTGYFNSAKSYLPNNLGFARSALQQILNDVNVDSSSTLTSEAYALLRFNTEYLLSQLSVPPASTYSLFATHSLYLEQSSTVYSGDIGVNAAGSSPFLDSDVELSVGIGVTTPATYRVKANRINLKSNATVNGNVYYNTLTSNGTITGSQNTPLSLPLTKTLPEFKTSTPGTQNVSVAANGTQTLQPGNYNNVDVNGGGTLIFTGGIYHFNSWNSGDNAQIKFQGPTEVRIAQKFDGGSGSYIGPQDTTSLGADQIMFYVAGINGTNGSLTTTPKAAKIGIGSTVRACFYAPNGTLWIRQSSDARGQFIGKDVDVGIGVKIRR